METVRYFILGWRKEKGFVGPNQKPVIRKTWKTGRGEQNMQRDLENLQKQKYQCSVFKSMPRQLK